MELLVFDLEGPVTLLVFPDGTWPLQLSAIANLKVPSPLKSQTENLQPQRRLGSSQPMAESVHIIGLPRYSAEGRSVHRP